MRRNDVASTSSRRRVPTTRFLINQCQIITFLILKSDIIENSRIELRGIVLQVQVGGFGLLGGGGGGGQRVCCPPPPSQIIGGLPPPPPLPTPMDLAHCGVSRAKDWVSLDCGTMDIMVQVR